MSRRLRRGRLAAGAVLLLALVGCGPKYPVHVDPASRASLAGYTTYAWMEVPDPKTIDRDPALAEIDRRAFAATEQSLAGRGYVRSDGAPQLFVRVHTTIDEQYSDSLGTFFRYSDAGGTEPLFVAFSLGYEIAHVTIEAYDATSRLLLWSGRTAVAMDASHREDRVAASVTALLKTFPAQPGYGPVEE
jgi:hypothetical protein